MTIAISTLDAKFDQNDLGQISARNLLRIARLHGKIVGGEQIVIPGSGPSGFDIVLRLSEGAAIGDFGGLVQDFYGLDEALNWAERCFVESYRLRIEHIGGWPRRWTLQKILANGGIIDMFASGHLVILEVLRTKSVEYRNNCGLQSGNDPEHESEH